MNKFVKNLSSNGNDVLIRRAENIGEQTRIAYQNLVNDLKQQKKKLELERDMLADMSPDTSDSLRPGTKDFDPVKWVEKMQELGEEIFNVSQALKIAEANYNEFFNEPWSDPEKS